LLFEQGAISRGAVRRAGAGPVVGRAVEVRRCMSTRGVARSGLAVNALAAWLVGLRRGSPVQASRGLVGHGEVGQGLAVVARSDWLGEARRVEAQNVNSKSMNNYWRSLRLSLAPTLIQTEYGFSQSRYVALDSLTRWDSGRANGRDGERPFFFSLTRKGRSVQLQPLLRTANLAKAVRFPLASVYAVYHLAVI
jgi:hypothetical protein